MVASIHLAIYFNQVTPIFNEPAEPGPERVQALLEGGLVHPGVGAERTAGRLDEVRVRARVDCEIGAITCGSEGIVQVVR